MSSNNTHTQQKKNLSLAENVNISTSVSQARCYQCGKCSAGCPLSYDMDYPPSLLLRMLQLETPEMDDKILRSLTIWLCLNCEMCIGRCPQEVDIPKMMDYLRSVSLKTKKVNPKAKHIIQFHRSFLDSINYTGKLYEVGLIADYKLRSKKLMQDVSVAPSMYLKGKLSLLPEMVKGRKNIKRIFSKTIKKS